MASDRGENAVVNDLGSMMEFAHQGISPRVPEPSGGQEGLVLHIQGRGRSSMSPPGRRPSTSCRDVATCS